MIQIDTVYFGIIKQWLFYSLESSPTFFFLFAHDLFLFRFFFVLLIEDIFFSISSFWEVYLTQQSRYHNNDSGEIHRPSI